MDLLHQALSEAPRNNNPGPGVAPPSLALGSGSGDVPVTPGPRIDHDTTQRHSGPTAHTQGCIFCQKIIPGRQEIFRETPFYVPLFMTRFFKLLVYKNFSSNFEYSPRKHHLE